MKRMFTRRHNMTLSLSMQQRYTLAFKILCMVLFLYQANCAYAEIHGTLTGTSNYVSRWYSKSNGKPAIQANLDYQHPWGFYVGVTASSFNIGPSELPAFDSPLDPAQVEVTPYVGWSFKMTNDWRVDLQYSRYYYDGLIYSIQPDYNEYYLFINYKDMLTAQVSYTDSFYGNPGNSYNYQLTGRYPLTDFLQFSTTYGYSQTQNILLADYQYWNIGITGTYRFISLDLRYHDAEEVEFTTNLLALPIDHPETLRGTIVFSISAGF